MTWLLASLTSATLAASPLPFSLQPLLAQAEIGGTPAATATTSTADPAASAGAPAQQGPGIMTTVVMMGLIFLFFWLFLIRPQNKQMKEHQKLVESLQKGDEVVTQSGIFGKIAAIEADAAVVQLEIAKGTIIRVQKAQIGRRQPTAAEVAEKAAADAKVQAARK